MNKKDITKIPVGKFLIVSVKITEYPENYENNLIIKISSITLVHTIKKIPKEKNQNLYQLKADIYAREFEEECGGIFTFFYFNRDTGLFYDTFTHKQIIKHRLWTPEDAPLTSNWYWISEKYKEIAFKL